MQPSPTTIAHMLKNPRFVSPSSTGSERLLRSALVVLVLLLGSMPRANAQGVSSVEVREVKLSAPSETTARLTIATSGEPRFVARVADEGKRLIIDISGAELKGTPGVSRGNSLISRVSSQTITQ